MSVFTTFSVSFCVGQGYGVVQYTEHMAIKNEHKGDTLVLEITNKHKEQMENLVKAYKIKDDDEAKLIAFLMAVADHPDVIGRPIGTSGSFFDPPQDWLKE